MEKEWNREREREGEREWEWERERERKMYLCRWYADCPTWECRSSHHLKHFPLGNECANSFERDIDLILILRKVWEREGCVCVRTSVCASVCVHICLRACVYQYVCVCISVYVCVWVYNLYTNYTYAHLWDIRTFYRKKHTRNLVWLRISPACGRIN